MKPTSDQLGATLAPTGRRADTNAKLLSMQIRKMALERGPSAKLPTARQLCETLGTTRATLHSALGELEARNVITRKQGSGIFVSPTLFRKSVSIALASSLFSENAVASPFWGILLGILVGEAQRRSETTEIDYKFHLVTQHESDWDRNLLRAMEGEKVHGGIVIGLTSQSLVRAANESNLPLVSYAGKGRWEITTDAQEVIALGAPALVDQGCRRVALWWPVNPEWDTQTEYEEAVWGRHRAVFQQSLTRMGAPFYPDLVMHTRRLADASDPDTRRIYQAQGYRVAMEVFGKNGSDKPDGVLCTDDTMTAGALAALQNLDIKVGRDVKVASHANVGSLVLFGHEDKMTLIDVDPSALARAMFDTLEKALAGEPPPNGPIKISLTIRAKSTQEV